MPDLLLEIGCEEIPARMLEEGLGLFWGSVIATLRTYRLLPADYDKVQEAIGYCTPRRLAVFCPRVISRQPNIEKQIMGPSVKVAFRGDVPTPAAEAFAKRVGLPIDRLQRTATPKGDYLVASVVEAGRGADEVLAEALPSDISGIYWKKSMHWRTGAPETFVRPIRWIVAILDEKVIPFEYAGIRTTNTSHGHRLFGGELTLTSADSYVEALKGVKVIVDRQQRAATIRKCLDAATRTIAGARWREDSGLLDTVVNLTEWPSVILGNFERQFLSLPEEVLVTVMRDHQKYFAVEDASGKLASHFLAVLNTDGDPDGLIRHGNERVLRARFNDARFFWDTDQKIPLHDRVDMLKSVTFQKDLGSRFAKARRVTALIGELSSVLRQRGFEIDPETAGIAGMLAQTDLTTELVKEFTELQGIVGGLYARAQGLPDGVADAIYDQYKPVSMEDSVPRTLEGAVLSISDKADTIAGMFALGLVPSGSKDPYALRRQANGIVKIIAEHKLPVKLTTLFSDALGNYRGSEAEKKFSLQGEAYSQAVHTFLRERLEFYLRDFCGLAYDVVNAALTADAHDVVDALARASAVAKVRPSADFEAISTSFKRMKNILRQAAETKKRVAHPFNPALLREAEEKKLAGEIPQVAKRVNALRADKQYEQALVEISRLRPAIDTFFDKVMVMVEDEELRANRLSLLKTLVDEFSSIADFSEIVTEKR